MSEYLRLSCLCNRAGAQVMDQPQLVYFLVELIPGEALTENRLPLNFACCWIIAARWRREATHDERSR